MQQNKNSFNTKILSLDLLVLVGLVWSMAGTFFDTSNVAGCGWLTIVIYMIALVLILKNNSFRVVPFFFFMAYCFMSNAGQTLVEVLHLPIGDPVVDIYARYSDSLIAEMLIIQSWFILFMTAGYIVFKSATKGLDNTKIELPSEQEDTFNATDLIFYAIVFLMFVITFLELSKRASMSYGDYYYEDRSRAGTLLEYIYHVFGFTYLMTHTGKKKKLALAIMACVAVMLVFIGSRSNILPLLVGFLVIASLTKMQKIKGRYVVLGVLILYLFSGMDTLRGYSLSEINGEVLFDIYGRSALESFVDIIMEMGGSARTTLSTMTVLKTGALQPDNSILYYLLKGLVPVQILEFFVSKPAISSMSQWITEYNRSFFGWGYSIIAEIFYNFGMGGILFSFLFGGLWAGCENWIGKLVSQKKYYPAAGILYLLGYSVFLARAETSLISTRMRYVLYTFVLYYFIQYFFSKKKQGGLK
ncbi:MAG: O-antigen polysaccharide polymerase Wzy [Clostridia bacterium]|nr:O-antigen polysaccharide polymerase Wzy [Clostridia bacterium]